MNGKLHESMTTQVRNGIRLQEHPACNLGYIVSTAAGRGRQEGPCHLAPVELDDDFSRVDCGRPAAVGTGPLIIVRGSIGREGELVGGKIGSREAVVIWDLVGHSPDPVVSIGVEAVSDDRNTRRET